MTQRPDLTETERAALYKARTILTYSMAWSETPQGHEYWREVCANLGAILRTQNED